MTTPGTTAGEPKSGYERLDTQIDWYDSKSRSAQNTYKTVKMIEVGCTAAIPVIAPYSGVVAGILGGVVLVFEAVQHLNQWHHNWITYRSNCEYLRHEKYLYLGRAAHYSGLMDDEAKRVLVERTEQLVSTEHAKWVGVHQTTAKQLANVKKVAE